MCHILIVKKAVSEGAPSYSVEFYEKVVSNKLKESDFKIENQTIVYRKLNVLPTLIPVYKKAKMVGDYNGYGYELRTNKLVGGVIACMGFVKNSNSKYYSPNTILDKDIRNVSIRPQFKLLAVLQKKRNENKYNKICFVAKRYEFSSFSFSLELEKLIDIICLDKSSI